MLLPYNYVMMANPAYRADVEGCSAVCEERRWRCRRSRPWPAGGGRTGPPGRCRGTNPCDAGDALERAVQYVLSRPPLFLNTSSEASLLRPLLAAASAVDGPPPDDLLQADVVAEGIQPLFDGSELERI